DCEQLVLYYFIQNGGAVTKKITISEFTDFVLNDLSNDKAYADMFDRNTLEQMKLLREFTNESSLKNEYTAKEIASKLVFDEEKFANADLAVMKSLFTGTGSFMGRLASRSSQIASAAMNALTGSSGSTYNSSAGYTGVNSKSIIDTLT
ncbi:MAG: hypothetical protein J6U61_10040, partial [Lachnospiraceae bacterium]|nr:hypothetical protein [Lachnospiraceae bacterium]